MKKISLLLMPLVVTPFLVGCGNGGGGGGGGDETKYTVTFKEKNGSLFATRTYTENNPKFTTPYHATADPNCKGLWRQDVEVPIIGTQSIYYEPSYKVDLSGVPKEELMDFECVWDELTQYKATFKDASGTLIPGDEIVFTKDDMKIKLPAAPDAQDNYKWYNEDENEFYDPGTDFTFKTFMDPDGHEYGDYEFIWKEEASTTEYTITFLDSDSTEFTTLKIPVGSSEYTINFPEHDDTGEDWGWHTNEIFGLENEYFSGNGEAKLTLPLSEFDNYTFKWEQNPNP